MTTEDPLGEFVRKGLAAVQQGIGTLTDVLRSGDLSVHEVDGALRGDREAESAEGLAGKVSELVRQGTEEAEADIGAPTVAQRFRDAWQVLRGAQPILFEGSPTDAIRAGLRDLRGSMALFRLASGTGSLNDLGEVTHFADSMVGRAERVVPAAESQVAAAPAKRTKPKTPKTPKKPSTKRRKKRSKGVLFAKAVADELADPEMSGWQEKYAYGDIDEPEWVNRLTTWAAAKGYDDLDDIYARAVERTKP